MSKRYVIINTKRKNYFNKYICVGICHFVCDIKEAKIFTSKKTAREQLDRLKKSKYNALKLVEL